MISLSKLNDSVTDTLLLLRYFANSYGDSEYFVMKTIAQE